MFGAANSLIGSSSGYILDDRHFVGDGPDSDNDWDYVGDGPDPDGMFGTGIEPVVITIVVASIAILVVAKNLGFRSMIAVNA